MVANDALRTPAWLLVGLGNVPGVLELAEGKLAFTTLEERVFDVALGQLSGLRFPWYYFGGGMQLQVDGRTHKLSFVRPNGAQDVPGPLLAEADLGGVLGGAADAVALLTAGRKLMDVGEGRKAGKTWRAILTAPAAQ